MSFTLPKLPYAENALEPYISAETIQYHYGKHHAAYVNNLNKMIAGTEFENASLDEIVLQSMGGLLITQHKFGITRFILMDCLQQVEENQLVI